MKPNITISLSYQVTANIWFYKSIVPVQDLDKILNTLIKVFEFISIKNSFQILHNVQWIICAMHI
jgi:hypothetical protein